MSSSGMRTPTITSAARLDPKEFELHPRRPLYIIHAHKNAHKSPCFSFFLKLDIADVTSKKCVDVLHFCSFKRF